MVTTVNLVNLMSEKVIFKTQQINTPAIFIFLNNFKITPMFSMKDFFSDIKMEIPREKIEAKCRCLRSSLHTFRKRIVNYLELFWYDWWRKKKRFIF